MHTSQSRHTISEDAQFLKPKLESPVDRIASHATLHDTTTLKWTLEPFQVAQLTLSFLSQAAKL